MGADGRISGLSFFESIFMILANYSKITQGCSLIYFFIPQRIWRAKYLKETENCYHKNLQ